MSHFEPMSIAEFAETCQTARRRAATSTPTPILAPDEPTVCASSYQEFMQPAAPLPPPPDVPVGDPFALGTVDSAGDTFTAIEYPLFIDEGYTLDVTEVDCLPLGAPLDDDDLDDVLSMDVDTLLSTAEDLAEVGLGHAETVPAPRQPVYRYTARIALDDRPNAGHQGLFRRLFSRRRR